MLYACVYVCACVYVYMCVYVCLGAVTKLTQSIDSTTHAFDKQLQVSGAWNEMNELERPVVYLSHNTWLGLHDIIWLCCVMLRYDVGIVCIPHLWLQPYSCLLLADIRFACLSVLYCACIFLIVPYYPLLLSLIIVTHYSSIACRAAAAPADPSSITPPCSRWWTACCSTHSHWGKSKRSSLCPPSLDIYIYILHYDVFETLFLLVAVVFAARIWRTNYSFFMMIDYLFDVCWH